MKPSPCLHPIRIKDPLSGQYRMVPCGKCAACVVNKGRERTERLEDAVSDFPFRWLVTCTYNDLNLPIAEYDEKENCFYHPNDCDYNGVVYSKVLDTQSYCKSDFDFILDCFKKYNGLPVLSHRDVINFKKRFRYYFKKLYPYAKLFIYCCGEYGETYYRPHYHYIFGTTENVTTSVFEICVRKAWSVCYKTETGDIHEPIGRIDVQKCVGKGCFRYVAQYLNSVTNLPKIYQVGKFRPFSTSSKNGDGLLLRISQSDVREVFNRPTLYVSKVRHGVECSVPVPSIYRNRYFPIVPKFGSLSNVERKLLYELYLYYPQREKAFYRFLTLRRVESNHLSCWKVPFDDWKKFVETPDTLLHRLVGYTCFLDKSLNYIEDKFVKKRNFDRLWYISRRVCLNARLVGVTVSQYVDRIIDYYKMFEMDKLKRFYDLQSKMLDDVVNPLNLSYCFSMYYNTDGELKNIDYYKSQFHVTEKKSDINKIPVQFAYAFQSEGILIDTTKTKKRNDYLISHGRRKIPFVPFLDSKITNFLNITKR